MINHVKQISQSYPVFIFVILLLSACGNSASPGCPTNYTGTYPNCVSNGQAATTTNNTSLGFGSGSSSGFGSGSSSGTSTGSGSGTSTGSGTGTSTSNATVSVNGLTWQKEDDGTTRKYDAAVTYCDGLSMRLPTKVELKGIVDSTHTHPAINPAYFTNTKSFNYWTSTPGTHSGVFTIDFADGTTWDDFDKGGSYYTRCCKP